LAKVVYFTRSPEPPNSPSIAATQGSSVVHSISVTPPSDTEDGSHTSQTPPRQYNGALTPSLLESSPHPLITGSSSFDRDLRLRASVQNIPGGSLNFERFETDNIDECIDFIRQLIERSAHVNSVSIEQMRSGVNIVATGGGAHKFNDLFREQLGIEVVKEDEMECLIEGLKFITLIPNEVYYFSDNLLARYPSTASGPPPDGLERPSPNPPSYEVSFESNPTPQLPCLLVNIGSGVSIIKVDEDGSFERVSGTSLGGATLWGLLSLLTPATTFDGKLWERSSFHTPLIGCSQKCLSCQRKATTLRSTCSWATFMAKTMDAWASNQRLSRVPSGRCSRREAKKLTSLRKTSARASSMPCQTTSGR
jgi:type II pantothenate kinase